MKTKAITLSLQHDDHCKRLSDPCTAGVYHCEAIVRFSEAARLDIGNANVRPPSQKKPAYKAMVNTMNDSPESFHIKNRGITYFCDKFQFDNKQKNLTITIPVLNDDDARDSAEKYGIADGGHTFDVIKETVQILPKLKEKEGWVEPFVRLHIISGKREELGSDEEIVEALNTSTSVRGYTIDEYTGQFDELKTALSSGGFDSSLIAFKENEDKEWHVEEIIQRLACFLKDRWKITQPASMYKSKQKALFLYTDDNSRKEFRPLYDIIYDVITFPEFIEAEFSQGNRINLKSHGRLRAVKPLPKLRTRAGTSFETKHKMDKAALLPMAAAFRELLRKNGDNYEWRVDPHETFRRCAKELHQLLVSRAKSLRTTSQLGADMEYWSACSNLVMRTMTVMQDES